MKLSIITVAIFWAAMCAGCHSVPSAFKDDAEFGGYVRDAKGRYLGCLGYAVAIPGISGFSDHYSSNDVLVLPGPGDYWRTEEDRLYTERAWKFAERYNLWLHPTKKPNKSPEPTPRPAKTSARSVVFDVVAGVAHL